MKSKLLTITFFFVLALTSNAQETIGLLFQDDGSFDGYTLFTPEENNFVYLVDNCGNLINTWTFTETPGATCYLLKNGNLLRAGSQSLEIRAWDNTVIWTYNLSTLGLNQHHDIEPLPNGNILCLVKETIDDDAQISMGKNPELISGNLKSEKIIELQPIGTNEISIVWEWRFVDHLIQDFDSSKANFGVVTDHPELIDFNYEDYNMTHSDWIHMNSIAFNEDLDQILMSSKSLGEIYIIDHSTTTAEASGHNGGISNKGGDFLWRWGNPEAYRRGTPADRKLFEQHDAKWVKNGFLHEGKISVFNNDSGGNQTHSSIHLLTPELDGSNTYQVANNRFLPSNFFWSWSGTVLGETVYENKKGGVHALPNGNMMFCETSIGRLTEVTMNGDIVWIYRNPSGPVLYEQYDSNLDIMGGNSIFRGEKYSADYIGFDGLDLSPGSIIEDVNTNSDLCNLSMSISDLSETRLITLASNLVLNNELYFSTDLHNVEVIVYDTQGKSVFRKRSFNGNELALPFIDSGLYFMRLTSDDKEQVIKIIVD